MELQHINHVAITVGDLALSLAWHREVLGLERRFEDEWGDVPTMVCAGETCVALFPSDGPNPQPVAVRETVSMRHFAFRADRANFEAARARFRELGIEFDSATTGSHSRSTSRTQMATGSRSRPTRSSPPQDPM